MATTPKTISEAREAHRRFEAASKHKRLCDCINGHFECAPDVGGVCVDDLLHAFPELEA